MNRSSGVITPLTVCVLCAIAVVIAAPFAVLIASSPSLELDVLDYMSRCQDVLDSGGDFPSDCAWDIRQDCIVWEDVPMRAVCRSSNGDEFTVTAR